MSEQQRVRDLTSAPRRLPIEVEGSSAFELILSIWSVFNPEESNTAFDLGSDWQDHIRELTPTDLEDEILALGGPYCSTWLAISSLLITAPHPHDPDNVYAWLAGIDDQRLKRWILGYSAPEEDEALIEQASQGDIEAVRALMSELPDHKKGFVDYLIELVETEGLPERFADALNRFRQEAFVEYEEEFGGAISAGWSSSRRW